MSAMRSASLPLSLFPFTSPTVAASVIRMMMPYRSPVQKPTGNQPRCAQELRYVSRQVSHAKCQKPNRAAASAPVPIMPVVWMKGVP